MKKKKKTTNGRRVGLQVVTLCISTSLVLILLGMVVFTGLTARNLSNYVKENLTVTVMFSGNVSDQQRNRGMQGTQQRVQHRVLRRIQR